MLRPCSAQTVYFYPVGPASPTHFEIRRLDARCRNHPKKEERLTFLLLRLRCRLRRRRNLADGGDGFARRGVGQRPTNEHADHPLHRIRQVPDLTWGQSACCSLVLGEHTHPIDGKSRAAATFITSPSRASPHAGNFNADADGDMDDTNQQHGAPIHLKIQVERKVLQSIAWTPWGRSWKMSNDGIETGLDTGAHLFRSQRAGVPFQSDELSYLAAAVLDVGGGQLYPVDDRVEVKSCSSGTVDATQRLRFRSSRRRAEGRPRRRVRIATLPGRSRSVCVGLVKQSRTEERRLKKRSLGSDVAW